MKTLLAIITSIILFSCATKEEKAAINFNKNLFTFFKANFKKEDSTIHLDSVRLIKLDTVTQSKILFRKIMSLDDDIDANNNLLTSMEKENHTKLQLVRLSAGLDKTLYENYLDEAKQLN
jgi:hypothetical protein